eukprot:CAMPEP_0184707366 /NCGR_PEP_ID=MMETSP0313-20130426/37235_1 /TAXON_ID=2792 /ORGANISM="Porphyridium aerugineum, Strain SAG 1380-2" /LENGTH=545 /DNA_ID=CAMNT_0027168941 /DNA_START=168 /DNA_END=1805 /DNA_ORIENTATION=+
MDTSSNLAFVGTSVPILRYSSTNLALNRRPRSQFHSKPKVYSKPKLAMSLGFQFDIPGATPEDYKWLNSATNMKEIQERLRVIHDRLAVYKSNLDTDKVTDTYFESLQKMTDEMKEEMLGGKKREEAPKKQAVAAKVEAPEKQEQKSQSQAPPAPQPQQMKKQEQQQAKNDQKASDVNMDELWGLDEDAGDPNFAGDVPKEAYDSDGDEEFDEQKLKEYEEFVRQQAMALKEEREQQREMERKMAERRKAAMEQAMAAQRAAQEQNGREDAEHQAKLEAQAKAVADAEKAKQQEAARQLAQLAQQAQQRQQASHGKDDATKRRDDAAMGAQFAKETAQAYAADIAKEMAKKKDRETKSFRDFQKEATEFVDQDEFGNATTKFDLGNRVPLSPRAIQILNDPNVSLEDTYEVLRVEMKEFQDERRRANPDAHRRNVNDYFAALNNPAARAEPEQVELTTTYTEIVAPPPVVHIDRYSEAASQPQVGRAEPVRAAPQYSAPAPAASHSEASLVSQMFAELQSFNAKKAVLEREHQIRIMQILEKYSH